MRSVSVASPAAAKERALAADRVGGELAVEEDGDAEVGDRQRRLEREVAGRGVLVVVEPQDRGDVERADARVLALVTDMSMCSIAARAPAASAAAARAPVASSVSTVRL